MIALKICWLQVVPKRLVFAVSQVLQSVRGRGRSKVAISTLVLPDKRNAQSQSRRKANRETNHEPHEARAVMR